MDNSLVQVIELPQGASICQEEFPGITSRQDEIANFNKKNIAR